MFALNRFLRMALVILFSMAIAGQARAADEIPPGRLADLPGVKLWFLDTGGNGVPVVLLHANTGTSTSWQGQFAAFAKAGYRVIAFDRRGWGQSMADPATGAQPGSVAGDLDALADFLKLDRFHLVGVAGGSFVALDYAAWRPERLRSIVAAASTGQVAEVREFTNRIAIPGLDKLPVVYLEVGPSYRGANPEGTKRWMELEEHARQANAPSQALRTPNNFAKLDGIVTPTLVLPADADLIAPPALVSLWAAHVKNREWAVIADAGHSVNWEQPEAFNSAVLAYLARH